jgi:hypothetical protein
MMVHLAAPWMEPSSGGSGLVSLVAFMAWAVLPFAVLTLGLRLRVRPGYEAPRALAAAGVALAAVYVYVRVMYFDPPDAQSALVFVFVPLYQMAAAIALYVAAFCFRVR